MPILDDGKLSRKEIIRTFGEFLDLIQEGKLKRYDPVTKEGCEPITRDYRLFMESKYYDVGSSQRIGKIIGDSKKFDLKMKYSNKYQNTLGFYKRKKSY